MFINEDFLLTNETAKKLYHNYAKEMPIIDYHCHLNPEEIVNDYRITSVTELWLGGDHYKWRAMRANGVPENLITGESDDWDKFLAWAETVENAFGNPLHHWTHLELKKYFGVTDLLTSKSAKDIYKRCNQYLLEHKITPKYLIKQSNVRFIGTTDDILDNLSFHKKLKKEIPLIIAPSFRPDPILNIHNDFSSYLEKCQVLNEKEITTYSLLYDFLIQRIDFFHEVGCKSADHGFGEFLSKDSTDEEIEAIFQKGKSKQDISRDELAKWQGRIMRDLGREYARRNWVMQIHFGAIRNTNTKLLEKIGTDIGCDSIIDQGDVSINLNNFLDSLDQMDELPRTIIYNLNPALNDLVATTCANYQSNNQRIKSKVQFGAAWWFNDHYNGMIHQIDVLANQGILGNFVGMLTDSRSFISYPRHDYFRRILCQYIGDKVESGYYPNEEELLKKMIQNIAFNNANEFFELNL